MSGTEVRWSMTEAEDPFAPIATDHETLLSGFWARVSGNAENTAEDVAENYFDNADDTSWSEHFGDADCATVRVIITEPPASAGTYEVELVRTIKATAKRIEVEQ